MNANIFGRDLNRIPVDDGDDPPVSPVSVRQDAVVHPRVFEAFHDRKGRAWKDGFDRPWWGSIVDGCWDLFCRRDVWLGQEGCGLDVSNAV